MDFLLLDGMDRFFLVVIGASLLAGMSAGLTGCAVVGMRIPFVPVCIAHAALLGAVIGVLAGGSEFWWALALAGGTAVLVGLTPTRLLRMDENMALAVLFSLSMGLVFLAIGLSEQSKTPMLSLLWGNLLFVDKEAFWRIAGALAGQAVLLAVFGREIKAVLFSRVLAASVGIRERAVYTGFLLVIAVVVTVNLQAVGGLMIFSLIVNPAAAAYLLCRGFKRLFIVSAALGGVSGLAGFYASYAWNLPTGACIVIVSALLFVLAGSVRVVLGRDE